MPRTSCCHLASESVCAYDRVWTTGRHQHSCGAAEARWPARHHGHVSHAWPGHHSHHRPVSASGSRPPRPADAHVRQRLARSLELQCTRATICVHRAVPGGCHGRCATLANASCLHSGVSGRQAGQFCIAVRALRCWFSKKVTWQHTPACMHARG